MSRRQKTWTALFLAALVLPGCQATQARNPDGVVLVQRGPEAVIGLTPTRPIHPQAQGFQETGCMDFGFTGSQTAGLVVLVVLLAPVFFVLRLFGG